MAATRSARFATRAVGAWWAAPVATIMTFDCFDTVITRAVGSPTAVGYVVAARLRAAGVCDVERGAYVAYRQQAERMAVKRLVDEATLTDVCAQLADLLGLPPGAAEDLARTEEDVELELSRPVPGGLLAVERARAAGHEVAFLSDTVLSSPMVGRLLDRSGVRQGGERLWVSNELGASKARGGAYAAVAKAVPSLPLVWRHVGDDDRADVLMARAAGVMPEHAPAGRLNRYERAWDSGAQASAGFSSLLAGAARRTRLLTGVEHPDGAPARSTTLAGIVAPLAAGYLLWALEAARARGCDVLEVGSAPGTAAVALAEALNEGTGAHVTVVAAGGAPSAPGGTVARLAWGWSSSVSGGRSAPGLDLRWCSPADVTGLGYLADGATGLGPALVAGTTAESISRELARALPQVEALASAVAGDGGLGSVLTTFTRELAGVMDLLDTGADVRAPAWKAVRRAVESGRPRATKRDRVARRWRSVRQHAGSLTTVTSRRLLPSRTDSNLGATRYEDRLRAAATEQQVLPALLADASLAVRADASPSLPVGLVEVSAGVVGPLLSGYVLWCLERAREAGCRRVCFVARDGEVLLRIAQRLVAASGEEGWDLRYLHGNRRAWLLPSLTGPTVEQVMAVASRGGATSVRSMLEWVSVEPEEIADALARAGQPVGTWDDALPVRRHRAVLAVLTDPAVAALVQARADEAAALAETYLRAQGLLEAEPFAIVEMEGHGNVGAMLSALLERLGARPPAVECYLALTKAEAAPGRNALGWVYDAGRATGAVDRGGEAYVATEMFTAGSHGSVIGYRAEPDGAVVPVLAARENARVLAWGLERYRALLDRYAEALGSLLADAGGTGGPSGTADVQQVTWAVLRDFWEHPTRAEVRAWGGFPSPGERELAIADGFTTRQVLESVRRRKLSMRHPGTWPAGVRRRAPWHLRLVQQEVERRRR